MHRNTKIETYVQLKTNKVLQVASIGKDVTGVQEDLNSAWLSSKAR